MKLRDNNGFPTKLGFEHGESATFESLIGTNYVAISPVFTDDDNKTRYNVRYRIGGDRGDHTYDIMNWAKRLFFACKTAIEAHQSIAEIVSMEGNEIVS